VRPAGATRSYRLTRDALAEALRFRLYTPDGRARLPGVIHAAAAGDWAPFLEEVTPGSGPGLAEGLYLSVTCAEDAAFIAPADAKAAATGTIFGEYRFRQQRRACAAWPHPRRPARSFAPVRSSVPTLIVSGERDPVTPPRWAERIMASLSRARHVVVGPHAHMPDGLEPIACLDDVVAAFFEAGGADVLDVSCLAALRPPPFTTSR
jgi:pimeloyl-ACP methyl ester carboxylesterase